METVKKSITFKKMLDLFKIVHNKDLDSSRRDRLSMAIVQLSEYLKYPMEQYNKKLLAIEQEYCSVDAEGNFFLDAQNQPIFSKFTKEKQKLRDEKVMELLEKEVDIELKYCTDFTRVKTMHLSWVKALNGYLFDLSEEQLDEMFIAKEVKEVAQKPQPVLETV